MSALILDTSGYTLFKKNLTEAVSAITQARTIIMPVITLGELQYGFAYGRHRQQNIDQLDQFLASPRVLIESPNKNTAERYGVIQSDLRKRGKPIPTNDIWIAALCWQHGGTLLTADAHFLDLPQIIVRHLVI